MERNAQDNFHDMESGVKMLTCTGGDEQLSTKKTKKGSWAYGARITLFEGFIFYDICLFMDLNKFSFTQTRNLICLLEVPEICARQANIPTPSH